MFYSVRNQLGNILEENYLVIEKTYDSSLQKWQIAQQGKKEIICEKLYWAMIDSFQ